MGKGRYGKRKEKRGGEKKEDGEKDIQWKERTPHVRHRFDRFPIILDTIIFFALVLIPSK